MILECIIYYKMADIVIPLMAVEQTIDESLYSRQIYALGNGVMQSITNATVLISGMNGVGVEIAKNAMLNGYKNVIIHDLDSCDTKSTNYYAHLYKDIHRAKTSYLELKTLNPNVKISLVLKDNYDDIFDGVTTFVLAECSDLSIAIKLNKICRYIGIKFIMAETFGSIGRIFCDFGEKFVVNNINGEKPVSGIIVGHEVCADNKIIFHTIPDKHHGLCSDDIIKIDGLEGHHIVTFVSRTSFSIVLNGSVPDGFVGGNFIQIKESVVVNFVELEESHANPEFMITDYLDMDRPTQLHTGVLDRECNTFAPLDYLIGGIASQELVKSVSNQNMPIKQWLYLDTLDITDYDVRGLRVFIVGAGAIGCELLKNFSMLGVNNICITDMDVIEKSNLNRQFLFRDKDIGKPKSEVACNYIRKFNNKLNITCHTNKVGVETEDIYNKQFYDNIDIVCGALDNVDARLYVDSKCVLYKKILLECGTLGTKGNVQVIIPNLTESYSTNTDPQEENIPVCTIKHFPTHINHCVQWALDLIEGLFKERHDPTKLFASEFIDKIDELLKEYPIDNKDFWSNGKKAPKRIVFDETNNNHTNFIKYANIILQNNTTSFEKDDDTNGHIDFIYHATCIRAQMYDIELISRHDVKGIAGKIIPALSTTTSVIASLVAIELVRRVNNLKPSNTYVNLAIPLIASSEPLMLKEHNNFWKTLDIKRDDCKTLGELMNHAKINGDIDYVTYESLMLYSIMLDEDDINERKDKEILELIHKYHKQNINGDIIPLTIGLFDNTVINIRYFY